MMTKAELEELRERLDLHEKHKNTIADQKAQNFAEVITKRAYAFADKVRHTAEEHPGPIAQAYTQAYIAALFHFRKAIDAVEHEMHMDLVGAEGDDK